MKITGVPGRCWRLYIQPALGSIPSTPRSRYACLSNHSTAEKGLPASGDGNVGALRAGDYLGTIRVYGEARRGQMESAFPLQVKILEIRTLPTLPNKKPLAGGGGGGALRAAGRLGTTLCYGEATPYGVHQISAPESNLN